MIFGLQCSSLCIQILLGVTTIYLVVGLRNITRPQAMECLKNIFTNDHWTTQFLAGERNSANLMAAGGNFDGQSSIVGSLDVVGASSQKVSFSTLRVSLGVVFQASKRP